MDRNIDRGLDLIKAKIVRLRQLLTNKSAPKQDKSKSLLNLTPDQLQKMTHAQRLIIEKTRQKVSAKTDKDVNQYADYTDCYGEYWDAVYE